MKELFLIKYQDYSLQMQQKRSSSHVVFKDFAYPLGTTNLRKSSFLLAAQNHLQSMYNSLSETIRSNLIILDAVLKRSLDENSYSEMGK